MRSKVTLGSILPLVELTFSSSTIAQTVTVPQWNIDPPALSQNVSSADVKICSW